MKVSLYERMIYSSCEVHETLAVNLVETFIREREYLHINLRSYTYLAGR